MSTADESTSTWQQEAYASVTEYNNWYVQFARDAYTAARTDAANLVNQAFALTNDLTEVTPEVLTRTPQIIKVMRMTSSPTWAVDRLIGISTYPTQSPQSGASVETLVNNMEANKLPKDRQGLHTALGKLIGNIKRRYDLTVLTWVEPPRNPTDEEWTLANHLLTDRLAQSIANPKIPAEQESRQVNRIVDWLENRGYTADTRKGLQYPDMKAGTFRRNLRMEGTLPNGDTKAVPIDIAVLPLQAQPGDLPVMIECKSAGDYTNVNKLQKEEATKYQNLQRKHGQRLTYALYLSCYFDQKFRDDEAASGFTFIWHHRHQELVNLGL